MSRSCEICPADLQLLLCAKFGPRLKLLVNSSSSLLPPGENFACEIFKVRALVRRDEDSPTEELHLVAKAFPFKEAAVRQVFDFTQLFRKEVFFYENIAPVLKDLALEFGEGDFEVAPRSFGSRKPEDCNDEGVVILMENLQHAGYYAPDKLEGSDLAHSRLTIKALARFHALGFACKHHRPDFFNDQVVKNANMVPFRQSEDAEDIFDVLFKLMMKDSRLAEHHERIFKLINPGKKIEFFTHVAEEPWRSIVHMDFWTNNILYHKDADGNLDDVKFIDFQNFAYNSPLRDIPYFLCTSTSHEVMTQHFDELLDLYYDTFIDVLKRMKVNVEPFSRDKFDAQLKEDASLEFFHSIIAIKFFTAEVEKESYDSSQLNQVIIFSEPNELAYDKWYHIVQTFMKQGWM